MFSNIGGKIKIVSQCICLFGITLSLLYGLVTILSDEGLILNGILIIICGFLASWIGSFMTYGFGQLIENSDILVEQVDILISEHASASNGKPFAKLQDLKNRGLITDEEYATLAANIKN